MESTVDSEASQRNTPNLEASSSQTSNFTSKSNAKPFKAKVFSKPSRQAQEKNSGCKKNKLRTSRDIYNRLKWDSGSLNIDISSVYIGYKDRFLGTCELRFSDFHPTSEEGDIPYHRIYYFRTGGPPLHPFVGQSGEIQVREDNWPAGSIILWDRETRQDLIFNSGELFGHKPTKQTFFKDQAITGATSFTPPSKYTVQPCYQFNHDENIWEATTTDVMGQSGWTSQSTMELKLISFNVLFDIYDPHVVQCEKRWPYLIDCLEDSAADLIALQEVTPTFLTLLESQPWVQKSYFLSEISNRGTTIEPYGQILLSKTQPFRVLFSNELLGKRSVICTLSLNERFLHISNVHLKSDHKGGDNSKLRQEMVQSIISTVSQLDGSNEGGSDFWIVGDTNFRNAERIVQRPGLEILDDVWELLMPSEERAFTADVENNGLTKKQTQRNQSERYDRIFIRATNMFQPKSIKIIGKSPIDFGVASRARYSDDDVPSLGTNNTKIAAKNEEQLWLSDHYGLECSFKWAQAVNTNLRAAESTNLPGYDICHDQVVNTSAVSIIPPQELLSQIQGIRSEFDPAFDRWPPHINLLYGFIPDVGPNFENACKNFYSALETMESFQLTLSEVGIFRHSRSSTVYLTTSDPEELRQLRDLKQRLNQEYPFCQNNISEVFNPHLTIAKFGRNDQVKMEELVQHWRESMNPITFTLDRINLISRKGGSPFRIKNTVSFGQMTNDYPNILSNFLLENRLIPISQEKQIWRSQIHAELQRMCNLTLEKLEAIGGFKSKSPITVHVTGSTFMNFHDDTSDMDILACGPVNISHQDFFKAFESVLEFTETITDLTLNSIVLTSLIPIARLSFHGIEIDLVYCSCPDPLEITDQDLALMSPTFAGSLDAFRESRKLLEIIPQRYHSIYQTVVRVVKFWAKQRNIYSKTVGFISSNQISILMAHTILKNPNGLKSPEQIVIDFFEIFSGWKWPKPVQCQNESIDLDEPSTSRFNKNTPKLMPILSPCYPFINKSRNVTKSTRTLIQREFQRGNEIFSRIFGDFESKWNEVLEPQEFQTCYPEYLCVQVCFLNELDLSVGRGVLESRLVALIVMLEQEHSIFVQPYTQIFTRTDHVESATVCTDQPNHFVLFAFLGLDTKDNPRADLSHSLTSYKQKFKNWTSQFCKSRVNIEIHRLPRHSSTLNSIFTDMQAKTNDEKTKNNVQSLNEESTIRIKSETRSTELEPQDQPISANDFTGKKTNTKDNTTFLVCSVVGLILIGGALMLKFHRKS